jgi:phage baseplate assembly protein gpV
VPAATATLGEVLDADDPDHLGRVRVALPAYAGAETDWRPVLSTGAGAGKGIMAIPDAGDRVLVLLPAGDPAAAVVLGGLFGDVEPDDTGVVGGAVKRWSLRTAGGQRVVLDDEGGRVVLTNHDGSTIDLAPDRVTVHAAADLTIEAPGATLTLRANRIAMEQATSPEDGPVLPGDG